MEETKDGLKLVRITNPLYLGNIAPNIVTFIEKTKPTGITYETLYTYLGNSIQFGQDKSEFWVAFDGENPIAFAHWLAMPLPHIGKVCCDLIMSWNRKREPVEHLIDKFIEFGKRHNSPLYEAYFVNEPIFRVFRKAAHKKGIMLEKTDIINAVGR